MKDILRKFVSEPLFDASAALLDHLHIAFNEVTRMPVSFESLYSQQLPKALQDVLAKVEDTFFIGTVDESSLSGDAGTLDAADITNRASEGRYTGMMLFAVDICKGESLTRSEGATLTRGFNRIAAAQPVILFIRQGHELSLSTCERSDYTQQWRDGEKLGKVSLLRGINCENPHRGHLDILASIGDKAYSNYEGLYKHWMEVFSNDLLTKRFYGELSDWYAWAVQVARFPNDLATTDDDEKFNHESCIRLITRLIFVWFLKQKHLIPDEFFDEQYIKDHFIEEFNPHDRNNLLYNPEQSRYYRLILQNLFFAMLNCPIVAEGKDTPNNRRFRGDGQKGFLRDGYNVNNLMRYKGDFKEGGAEKFVQMANSHVPFLNGGLFDCLDKKPEKLYYDGFSERKESLEQLYLPDWLFFGDEVGRSIDLSQWYGDAKKKKVSARGIIDILKRYNFTIEENTPLDQEVSLDPELLGKAFENLLASYNPETKTSARKQTGSFYTPREIVQYMVDESLVAHLKRTCGEELEPQYRSLLSYSTEETSLTEEQRRAIMQAIYHCKVLDPACGSGAFPMGILQQMVHILRQLDPTNEMWKEFVIDLAIEQSKIAFAEDEEAERKVRLADIEEAFNKSINDPDYARKLYLIEHCIYGVDIQPIAVQISKLRFFISLVVDQKPTNDTAHNFGIRPLPNLESKFVAANTLIPVDYDASLFESTDAIIAKKEQLKELNHKIFLAKRNIDKQRLRDKIKETRTALAKAIEETGFVNPGAAQQLADWDMFEQNTSSPFFDAEWMFGVKGGFDIVIANPPYVDSETMENTMPERRKQYKDLYRTAKGNWDMFVIFIERGNTLLCANGVQSFIVPNKLIAAKYASSLRTFLQTQELRILRDYSKVDVFEAFVYPCVFVLLKQLPNNSLTFESMSSLTRIEQSIKVDRDIFNRDILWDKFYIPLDKLKIILSISSHPQLSNVVKRQIYGSATVSEAYDIKSLLKEYIEGSDDYLKFINTGTIDKYRSFWKTKKTQYIKGSFVRPVIEKSDLRQLSLRRYKQSISPKLIIAGMSLVPEVFYDSGDYLAGKSTSIILSSEKELKFLVAVLNSKLIGEWFKINFNSLKMSGGYITIGVNEIGLIPIADKNSFLVQMIVQKADTILERLRENETTDVSDLEAEIDILVYHLYNLTYDEILIIDPETPITKEEYESYI